MAVWVFLMLVCSAAASRPDALLASQQRQLKQSQSDARAEAISSTESGRGNQGFFILPSQSAGRDGVGGGGQSSASASASAQTSATQFTPTFEVGNTLPTVSPDVAAPLANIIGLGNKQDCVAKATAGAVSNVQGGGASSQANANANANSFAITGTGLGNLVSQCGAQASASAAASALQCRPAIVDVGGPLCNLAPKFNCPCEALQLINPNVQTVVVGQSINTPPCLFQA